MFRRSIATGGVVLLWGVLGSVSGPAWAQTSSPLLPEARDLLSEVRDGLEAGRKIETLAHTHSVARIESGGSVIGRVETWARRDPPALVEVLDLSGVTQTATLVGDRAWFRDPNGRVREATGDEAASYRLAHALLFHTYLDAAPAGFQRILTSSSIVFVPDGRGAPRSLELGGGDGDRRIPTRFLQRQQGVDLETTFSEWRPVDGVLFPFQSEQTSDDGRFDLVIVTTEVSFPDRLDPDRFLPPGENDSRQDARITDPALATAIPVKRLGTLLSVDVTVNGRHAGFLIDTGAAATVLSSRFAETLGLPARGLVEARGAGGSEPARFVDVDRLTLPGVEVTNQTLVMLPLDGLRAAFTVPIDGILGYDFLSRFAVEVDYPGERLALFAPGTYEPPPGASLVPLRIEANVPRIDAALDELPAASFLLDLGNASPLVLHTAFAAEHGYADRATPGSPLTGIGGVAAMSTVTVDRLVLGSETFRDVDASIARSARGVLSLDESVGNLGSGLFANSIVAFDYGAGALWIVSPSADSASDR